MRAALAVLAAACIAVGAGAGSISAVLVEVARSVGHDPSARLPFSDLAALPTLGDYEPALVALALGAVIAVIAAISRFRSTPARRSPTWTGGIAPERAFEYTATSFSKPLRLFFEPVLRPDRELRVELHHGTPFARSVVYRSEVDHVIESRAYGPLHRASIRFSQLVRRLQQGTLQLYLAYTVGTIVILLLLVRR